MKKMTILIILAILVLFLPGCFKTNEIKYDYAVGDIRIETEKGKTKGYTNKETNGIEILLSGNAEGIIEVSDRYLKIEKKEKDNTLIAIAKIGERIKEGEQIFTANRKIEKEEILEINSIKMTNEETFEIASIPTGISIESKTIPVNSEGYISIYGKGINDLKGCELEITYDASYLEIDTTKGNNGVERLNSMVNGLMIVQHENNKLIISSVLNESVNITEEEIYRINIKTKEERGETNIGITGESRDSNKEIIGLDYTGGTIKIGREYKLLGDFDGNCSVGLIDFMNFVDHYNSEEGETEYEITYDIAPAERGVDVWSDIYVICEPDGRIGLMDFIVFADNYRKECPVEYHLMLTTAPCTELAVIINNTIYMSPKIGNCSRNETIEIGVITPQEFDKEERITGNDTRYIFEQWNDGNTDSTRTVIVTSDTTYTANMKKEYKVETKTIPENIVEIEGAGWYTAESSQTFTSPGTEGYVFDHWEINEINAGTETTINVKIDNPKSIVSIYNQVPTIEIPDQSIEENETLTLNLNDYANDPEGEQLDFELLNGVGEITDATYTYTPDYDASGTYIVEIEVSDEKGAKSQDSFTITVNNKNRPPEKPTNPSPSDGETEVSTDTTLSWESTDIDGDELTYDVYFGTDSSPTCVSTDQTEKAYDPGILELETTYYWKVDVNDGITKVSGDLWTFVTISTTESTEVIFDDPNLEQVVREVIDKASGPIYESDVSSITKLNASSKNISELGGIEALVNINELILHDNQISDLSPTSDLSELDLLSIGENQISDLAPLVELPNLRWLAAENNLITDLTQISSLTQVTQLFIGYNPLENLDQLKQFTWLSAYGIGGLGLTDITFIEDFDNLSLIYFPDNNVSDITPLLSTNIMKLDLSYNPIQNIDLLSSMTQIDFLIASGLDITDVSFLDGFSELYYLRVNDNSINDISPLASLTNLKSLSIQNNHLKDISPLASLTKINFLILSSNYISDISKLVSNTAIDSGDIVYLQNNYLDLTPGSTDMNNIQILISRDVDLQYERQNQFPDEPFNPSPADEATGIEISPSPVLDWDGTDPDGNQLVFDVYFGNSSDKLTLIATELNVSQYQISESELTTSTTYYWKIVSKENQYIYTEGPIWSFTTADPDK